MMITLDYFDDVIWQNTIVARFIIGYEIIGLFYL